MKRIEPDGSVRISLPLRVWIGVEVLFGVLAILSIGLFPDKTAENFAWAIQATVTASLLGGFYFAAGALFVPALFARRWENIRAFVPASILFTSAELLATLLHWDKFLINSTPFYVWLASYLLPPPLFLFFYVTHQRASPPIPRPGDEPLVPALRMPMLGLGALLVTFAVSVFAVPTLLIVVAPIAFTPLTARALSGWVLATGMMLLMAARENDRTRARIVSPFLAVAPLAIAFETSRFSGQIDPSRPAFFVAVATMAIVCGIGLTLVRGEWRRTLG